MTTLTHTIDRPCYQVIHPLYDEPEEKRSAEGLGPMTMTPAVKFSLFALRGYLILMGLLVLYRLLTLAGVFGHPGHFGF
jgi:hypothetical protein